jgi:hypothetical protein
LGLARKASAISLMAFPSSHLSIQKGAVSPLPTIILVEASVSVWVSCLERNTGTSAAPLRLSNHRGLRATHLDPQNHGGANKATSKTRQRGTPELPRFGALTRSKTPAFSCIVLRCLVKHKEGLQVWSLKKLSPDLGPVLFAS